MHTAAVLITRSISSKLSWEDHNACVLHIENARQRPPRYEDGLCQARSFSIAERKRSY